MSPSAPRKPTSSRSPARPNSTQTAAKQPVEPAEKPSRPPRIPTIHPDSVPTPGRRRFNTKKRPVSKRTRILVISSVAAVIIGVAVWLTLPAFSLQFAASQSGVKATTPYFVPRDYSLQFPIKAEDNKVILTYTAKDKKSSFTISQEASTWDSQSVKHMVDKESEGRFLTTSDRGLTIYTYGGNAAWVNKGVLYKIHGNSRLSSETLTQIAGSF